MSTRPFVPKGQDGLLLRSPLTFGFSPHSSIQHPKPIYTKDWDMSYVLGQKHREVLGKCQVPEKLAFYTRHNPHPGRVFHMKGLLDVPICCVEDSTEPRCLLSPPTGQDLWQQAGASPRGNTRYSANINKGLPAVGVVPVTSIWRDELERKTQKAILRAMGETAPPSRASIDSQTGVRKHRYFDELSDEKLLTLLCRILQTDSIPACLAWLSTASETEKSIVLNMIKMAACGELQDSSLFDKRPHTSDSQVRYVWAPENSQQQQNSANNGYNYYNNSDNSNNEDINFPYQSHAWEEKVGGLADPANETAPFKLPENDTIVRTAHQLSRLASRNSSRADGKGGVVKGLMNIKGGTKGRSDGGEIDRLLAQTLNQQNVMAAKIKRQRSASLTLPTPPRAQGKGQKRVRSRSVNADGKREILPPIGPAKASVTKETIQDGGKTSSARLRYTSHWDTT